MPVGSVRAWRESDRLADFAPSVFRRCRNDLRSGSGLRPRAWFPAVAVVVGVIHLPARRGQYSSGSSRQVEARRPSSPTASVMTQILAPVRSV